MSDAILREPTSAAVDQGTRAAETPEAEVQTEEDVVASLKRQLEELEARDSEKEKALQAERDRAASAERARQAAEARATEATNAAHHATTEGRRSTEQAQFDAIGNALNAQTGKLETLEQQLAAAHGAGDFAAVAKINREMAVIGGHIAQLEAGKAELDARIKNPPADTGRQPQQQPSADEAREQFIQARPPLVQDWLRSAEGSRFFSDQNFQRRAIAAAQYAENNKGIPSYSQDYLDFIRTELGLIQRQQETPTSQTNVTAQPGGRNAEDARQAARMTTAPAGGAVNGSVRTNAGVTEVYLTREEKEQARRDGIPESEYARHKADLIKEGRIGPGAR
jgi:hypothetical protein